MKATLFGRLRGSPATASAPQWVVPLLLVGFTFQAALSWTLPRPWDSKTSPGQAPAATSVMVASLGESKASALGMMLYLQTFDSQAGGSVALRRLDQAAVRSWINRALELDPQASYPLLLASRVYASSARHDDARAMLSLVRERFAEAPNERWPWMAHAVHVARVDLQDDGLARDLAAQLRERATGAQVPSWAKQMEIFLLEALDDREAAQRLLGGLLQSGQVKDPAELEFLAGRMKALMDEAR
jgi:hypothetical protein